MKTNLILLSLVAILAALGWRAVQMFGAGGVVGSAAIAFVAAVYAWQRALFRSYAHRLAASASIVATI
jgi:hypothetical protein